MQLLRPGTRHRFEADQWLPFPLPVVFAFFANPQNLSPLMPAWQHARIEQLRLVAPPPPPPGTPVKLGTGAGTTMVLSFRLLPYLPVYMNWHAMIPEFVWNDHFCDEQTAGPFRYWRHCHSVKTERRDGVNGTVVNDRVAYEMPLGPLGDTVNRSIGPALFRYLFKVRHKNTAVLMPLFAEKLTAQAQGRTQ